MKSSTFISIASILILAAGCAKEQKEVIGVSTLSATIQGSKGKTSLKKESDTIYNVLWDSGDQIWVDGTVFSATPDNIDRRTAQFDKVSGPDLTVAGPYTAWYPTDLVQSDKTVLPGTQYYNGTTLAQVSPMYGTGSNRTLQFFNICALLRITLTGDYAYKVSKITVEDESKPLSGEFELGGTDGKTAVVKSGTAGVTLNLGNGLTMQRSGLVVYISIPAGTYSKLTFKVFRADKASDTATWTQTVTNKTIVRSSLYNVELSPDFVPDGFIDMGTIGSDGSKIFWADRALAATSIDSYGGYYIWGYPKKLYTEMSSTAFTFGTKPADFPANKTWKSSEGFAWENAPWTNGKFDDTSKKNVFTKYIPSDKPEYWGASGSPDNKKVLDAEDDPATVAGSKTRTPTQGEFGLLVAACNWESTTRGSSSGFLGTNKTDSSKKIFLSAGGIGIGAERKNRDVSCYYWSSSLSSSPYKGIYFIFSSEEKGKMTSANRCYGMNIRPVYINWPE